MENNKSLTKIEVAVKTIIDEINKGKFTKNEIKLVYDISVSLLNATINILNTINKEKENK